MPLTYVSSTLDQFKGSFRHTSLPSTPELSDKPSSSTGEVEATEMLSRTVAGENYPSIGAVVMKNSTNGYSHGLLQNVCLFYVLIIPDRDNP